MLNPWLKNSLLNRTRLSGFILLSLGIHLTMVIVHMTIPEKEENVKGPPPIRVKYIEPEKKKTPKTAQIIDTPTPPPKKEKARVKEFLAKYDSRSHSNTAKKPKKTYQRKKTAVPKSKGLKGKTRTIPTQPKEATNKPEKRASVKPRKRLLPQLGMGKHRSLTKKRSPSTSSVIPKTRVSNSLALLDGFNPDNFASLNTEDLESIDDDIPISLDTTEVKYASYFARIKHQIERVWVYPSEAVQRGISGDLTLTFRISKDGNLLGVRLLNRSGYEILDVSALKAIKQAAPFYPFPASIDREKLSVQANFIYTPQVQPIGP